jgi:hypothetical protein
MPVDPLATSYILNTYQLLICSASSSINNISRDFFVMTLIDSYYVPIRKF